MTVKIEVRPTEDKRFGMYVNGILIADSKLQCDADHGKVMLTKALEKSEQ